MKYPLLKVYFSILFVKDEGDSPILSIGMVTEDDTWFYAECVGYYNKSKRLLYHDMNKFNVKFFNNKTESYDTKLKGDINVVKSEMLEWLKNESNVTGKQIQLYAGLYENERIALEEMIKGISYLHPDIIDLFSSLRFNGINPEINLMEFIHSYKDDVNALMMRAFKTIPENNTLMQAAIIKYVYMKIRINDFRRGGTQKWQQMRS